MGHCNKIGSTVNFSFLDLSRIHRGDSTRASLHRSIISELFTFKNLKSDCFISEKEKPEKTQCTIQPNRKDEDTGEAGGSSWEKAQRQEKQWGGKESGVGWSRLSKFPQGQTFGHKDQCRPRVQLRNSNNCCWYHVLVLRIWPELVLRTRFTCPCFRFQQNHKQPRGRPRSVCLCLLATAPTHSMFSIITPFSFRVKWPLEDRIWNLWLSL